MWCPNCKSKSPLVALHHETLLCARCHTEVTATPSVTSQDVAKPTSQGVLQRPVILPLNAKAGADEEHRVASETPLYRFDGAHKTRRNIETPASTRLPEPSTKNSTSDSPNLVALISIFFVGQALVIWAYFQQNANALGLGMVLSVAAVGLGLQAIQPRREMSLPLSNALPNRSNEPETSPTDDTSPSIPKMRVLPGTRTQPSPLRKTRRPPVRDS